MGQYIDLLRSLPKTRRDVAGRAANKSPNDVRVAKYFGREYFDGDRRYGYGGYRYDGRWKPVARDIMRHYFTEPSCVGVRALDVGAAKGFLVRELRVLGVDAYGLDASHYAVAECPDEYAVGRLHLGTADDMPFPDRSFDLVLSINTLHNLPRPRLIKALQEMRRVWNGRTSGGGMFVQVDSYRTPEEKALFEDWVLTAEWAGTPDEWLALFAEAGYDGDYAFTIVEG